MTIRGRALQVRRGGTAILHGIDFTAGDEEFVGVLGPSGSGKSTLLLALSGFWRADEGTVRLGRRDLYEDFDALKHRIGFVPQDDIVPTVLTVESVFRYAAQLRLPDFSEREREGRITGVLHELDLADHRDHRVDRLSGGQRKRVNVGVELLGRPNVLFADEPTSGLDPGLERDLTESLRDLARSGSTVVVTTHVMYSLEMLDRLYVLHGGRAVYEGPVEEVKDHFGVDDYTDIFRKLDDHDLE